MTGADVAVVVRGLVLIAALAWYFFAPRKAVDAQIEGGRQSSTSPSRAILVPAEQPASAGVTKMAASSAR